MSKQFSVEEISKIKEILEKPHDIIIAESFETLAQVIRKHYDETQTNVVTPSKFTALCDDVRLDLRTYFTIIDIVEAMRGDDSIEDFMEKINSQSLDARALSNLDVLFNH